MYDKRLSWFENVESRVHPWQSLGLNWLTASICVTDVKKAVSFYADVMRMVPISEFDGEDGEQVFARIRYRGNNFVINKENWDSDLPAPESSKQAPPVIFYLYVDDVRRLTEEMAKAGATILQAPENQFWGDLKSRVRDPFGYYWDLAQKIDE